MRWKPPRFEIPYLIMGTLAGFFFVLCFALLHSTLNMRSARKMAQIYLTAITNGVTETTDCWIREKKKQIGFLAESDVVVKYFQEKKGKVREYFSRVLQANLEYEVLFLTDLEGRVIFDSWPTGYVPVDLRKGSAWKALEKNKFGLTLDTNIQKSPATGKPILVITSGVFDGKGRLLGVIGCALDWDLFNDTFILPIKVGQTGYVGITDEQYRNISHPDKNLNLKNLSFHPFIRRLVDRKNGFQRYPFTGVIKYMSYRQLKETGWVVSAHVNESELLGPSIKARNIILLMSVLSFLLVLFVVGYIDIFRLEQAEREAKASEWKFKILFHRGNDGIFVHAVEMDGTPGALSEANEVFCRLIGMEKEEILNRLVEEGLRFQDPSVYRALVQETLVRKYKMTVLKLLPVSGGELFVEVRLFLLENREGVSILGFLRDITERIEFEEQLKENRDDLDRMVKERTRELTDTNLKLEDKIRERLEMEEALRESEEKYRNIVEMANDGILVVQSGIVVFANRKICEILKGSEETIRGVRLLSIVSADDRLKVLKCLRARNLTQMTEVQLVTLDQQTMDTELSAGPITYEGNPADFLFVRDVTEKKRAEEEKKRQREQLVQADKMVALGTLVSGVAHEINNPNNSIMLNAPILAEMWKDVLPILEEYCEENGEFMMAGIPYREAKGYIEDLMLGLRDSSRRIKSIVEDLKNFARPSRVELTQDVDINEMIASSINLVSNLVKKSTEKFMVEFGYNLPPVRGNFQRLEQVMVNLIQNSCEALEDRKKGVRIATGFSKKENAVEIRVSDDGMGISPDHITQIMDPFFTTKRERGGTGLGLSVSSSIIKEHKGTMVFESQPGIGTTVTIRIPVRFARRSRK